MFGLEAVIPALSKVVSGGMAVAGLNRLWNIRLEEPSENEELNPALNPGIYRQDMYGAAEEPVRQPTVTLEDGTIVENPQVVLARNLARAHEVLDQELGMVTDLSADQELERRVKRGDNPDVAAMKVAETHRDGAGEESSIAMHGFLSMAMDGVVLDTISRIGDSLVNKGLISQGTAISAQDTAEMALRPEVFLPSLAPDVHSIAM